MVLTKKLGVFLIEEESYFNNALNGFGRKYLYLPRKTSGGDIINDEIIQIEGNFLMVYLMPLE